MLKWLMKRKLRAFGDALDDTRYGAELVDTDVAAGLALARLSKVAAHRADASAAAWYAGKIVALKSGHGRSCQSVETGADLVAPSRLAYD